MDVHHLGPIYIARPRLIDLMYSLPQHLVDWNKAMIPQVWKMGDQYGEWVNKAVDRQLRLFGPWYLECLTKTPWWTVPLVWAPTIAYLIVSECLSNPNIRDSVSMLATKQQPAVKALHLVYLRSYIYGSIAAHPIGVLSSVWRHTAVDCTGVYAASMGVPHGQCTVWGGRQNVSLPIARPPS